MGSAKVSDFADAGPLDGTELVPVIQAGVQKKVPLSYIWVPKYIFRPEKFLAVGNGVADDYQAWMDLAAAVNANGGGIIECAVGATYLFDRFITALNALVDPKFIGVKALIIEGNGAKFKLKGGWDRDLSTSRSIIPLRIQDGYDIEIRNFEVDGQSNTITNSSGATVPYSHGVSIESCERVTLDNINSHHHMSDGLRIDTSPTQVGGTTYKACRDVIVRNFISKFNVRLGLSLIQGRDCEFDNCTFSFTAFNDEVGTATGFLNGGGPKAGVDIEPNYTPWTASPSDILTGNITFRKCSIKGNSTSSLLCFVMNAGQYRQDNVTIDDCDIDHVDGQTAAGAGLGFECPGGRIINSRIDVRDSVCQFGVSAAAYANMSFEGNVCYGRMTTAAGAYLINQATSGRDIVEDNEFICTNTGAAPNGSRFLRVLNSFAVARGNRVVIPAAAYADFTGTDLMIAVTMDGKRAENNSYETDLVNTAGSSNTAHFGVMYGDNTVARNERFVGTGVGWTDTIRPGRRTAGTILTWNTNYVFNSNQRMALVQAYNPASLATNAATAITTTAVADAGMGAKVDITFSLDSAGIAWFGNTSSAGNVKWWGINQAGTNPLDLAAGDITLIVTNPTL